MKLHDISFQSLKRRKAKTIFLIVGLMIAVASVVTLIIISKTINETIAKNLDEFGANILIVPQNEELALNYGGMTVSGVAYGSKELDTDDIEKIKTIKNKENLSIISPKLLNVAKIADLPDGKAGKNVMIVGINVMEELRLKKWWKLIGSKPTLRNEIIIGTDIKKKFNTDLNKELVIKDKSYKVAAILEPTGAQDDQMIFMDINEAQMLFNKSNSLSLIEIAALCYNCPIEEIVRQTSEKLPAAKVTAIRQTIETKMEAMHRFEQFSIGISVLILIISGLIVFTNVSASVNERTREIGIFRAVGFRRFQIIKMILIEVFVASSTAGAIGFIIGLFSSKVLAPIISMDSNTSVLYDFNLLAISIALSITVGFLSSIYPAYRASKLDPTIALRSL
ncbi:MAG: ABC transporter permease [Bacteroidota bacterium]